MIATAALIIGFLLGYFMRPTAQQSIQDLIDLERAKRISDGLYRRGDLITETEPVEDGVYQVREITRGV